ncbi:MAG: hypothetical protein ACYC48_02335 [Minisyncoccota bacterium]
MKTTTHTHMKKPTQCALWSKEKVEPWDLNLESLEVFTNEPLLKRELFRCRECGQLYFHEWYEHHNFRRDAYMYDTFIPVDTEEDITVLTQVKSSAELMAFLPQLHGSYTNSQEDTLKWIGKDE